MPLVIDDVKMVERRHAMGLHISLDVVHVINSTALLWPCEHTCNEVPGVIGHSFCVCVCLLVCSFLYGVFSVSRLLARCVCAFFSCVFCPFILLPVRSLSRSCLVE